ncbi:MAG: prepilin-type N-terminal cleavage/methylation domain-containing protein [Planctomycetota bacterium]|jgi:prepilin-type N-terminal cleavage/methylation domain-containing protein
MKETFRKQTLSESRSRCGFTLIELLVVIAIIALLLAIAIPGMMIVKEKARRTICQTNIHSSIIAILAYSSCNDDELPEGGLGGFGKMYICTIPPRTKELFIQEDGNFDTWICPNLKKPFDKIETNYPNGLIVQEGGYLIGYNYLAGFLTDPDMYLPQSAEALWVSPDESSDSGRLEIITELNTWSSEDGGVTFAPHGKRGPIHEGGDSRNRSHNGVPSEDIGAVGGNIGYLDGSVKWKRMEDMKIHYGYGVFASW